MYGILSQLGKVGGSPPLAVENSMYSKLGKLPLPESGQGFPGIKVNLLSDYRPQGLLGGKSELVQTIGLHYFHNHVFTLLWHKLGAFKRITWTL